MCDFTIEKLRKRLHNRLGNANYYFMGSFALNKLLDDDNRDNCIDIVVKDLEVRTDAISEIVDFSKDTCSRITELYFVGGDSFGYWKVVLSLADASGKINVNIFVSESAMKNYSATMIDKDSFYRYSGLELYAAWCIKVLVDGNAECVRDRIHSIVDLYIIDDYISFPEDFNGKKHEDYLISLGVYNTNKFSALEAEFRRFDYFSSCVDNVINKDYNIREDAINVLKIIKNLMKNGYILG